MRKGSNHAHQSLLLRLQTRTTVPLAEEEAAAAAQGENFPLFFE